MSKNDYLMTQCEIQKGRCLQIAWIPDKFAKKNTFIKIKDSEEGWSDGWKINRVGQKISYKVILESEMNYKHHREATDI